MRGPQQETHPCRRSRCGIWMIEMPKSRSRGDKVFWVISSWSRRDGGGISERCRVPLLFQLDFYLIAVELTQPDEFYLCEEDDESETCWLFSAVIIASADRFLGSKEGPPLLYLILFFFRTFCSLWSVKGTRLWSWRKIPLCRGILERGHSCGKW